MIRVACIGDSITWGFTLLRPSRQSYPALLREKLGQGNEVRNWAPTSSVQDSGFGCLPGNHRSRHRSMIRIAKSGRQGVEIINSQDILKA